MSEALLLTDEETRAQALDPMRSFIVQAPAGSGKTELLTQRYLRLLATVDTPEQILAITFTRKAASEMRNRVIQALQRASDTPRPEVIHEARQWDLARDALNADARRGWQLLMHPARLRIHTIDALNASLSKRLPILAGLGASMEIAQDIMPIYERVAVRLLEQLGSASDTAQQLEAVLLHLANRVPDFVFMLSQLLARRDHWLGLVMQHRSEAELRASMERTLQAAIAHHLRWITDCIPVNLQIELVELTAIGAANRLKNGVKPEQLPALLACSQLTHWPEVDHSHLDAWRGLAWMICKADGELYRSIDARHGFPTDNKALKNRMLAALNELRELPNLTEQFIVVHELPSPTLSEPQWQVLSALLGLLPSAVAELMLEFEQRGRIDYVELAQRALQALGSEEQPTDIALALDARLQHVLVDEFQDTSIPQRSLLQALLAGWLPGDGRTLFCVGDPMQSIYRFRQAEVGLFLELQSQGLPPVKLTPLRLLTNFRSTRRIVEWVNECFPHVLAPRDDAELGAVSYSASVPQPAATADGCIEVHPGIDRSVMAEAEAVAELVHDRLQKAAQRIAVLVSNRSHVNAIAMALKRSGIAFNAVEIERLQERPLVQDLICLTRALLHLGDRTAWLACLRAPWCGLALSDLFALAAADKTQTVWQLLNDIDIRSRLSVAARERLEPVIPVFEAALAQRARMPLHDWVESCWVALGGPAILRSVNDLEDAEAFFTRLDGIEVAGDLEDVQRLEAELGELYATPANSAETRVEIMTIHKSKGLEFDVVILPSLHRSGGREDKTLLRWARLRGLDADGLVLAPPAPHGDEHDPIYRWLTAMEKRRAELERGRLLYVAATRARRELHLFGSVGVTPKGEVRAPKKGSLLKLLWPQVEPWFAKIASSHVPAPVASAETRQSPLRRLPRGWRMPAAEPALVGQREPMINLEQGPEFDWAGETSRHVGTVVHAELERLMKLALAEVQHWSPDARRPQLLLRLAELGVPDALRASAVERVVNAIQNTLQDRRGRWILGIDGAHQDAASELALTGVFGGRVVNSIIDRSFLDEEGVRWIVDFKTSIHEGGGRDEFLRSEIERYRSQLEHYARLMRAWKPVQPIRTALYFPLLGEWREVVLGTSA